MPQARARQVEDLAEARWRADARRLASRLLLTRATHRSGVPLEQPTHHDILPYGCRERLSRPPCPPSPPPRTLIRRCA